MNSIMQKLEVKSLSILIVIHQQVCQNLDGLLEGIVVLLNKKPTET
jgi:hypothetical protein